MSTETKTGENITIEGAPQIPGLVFRHFRGAEDFPAMAEVAHAQADADGLEDARSADDMARNYAHLKNFDPEKDMVMVELDGKLAAFARTEWWLEEANGNYIYGHFASIAPHARGKGIEDALFHHNENRLREIAGGHPADAPKFFEVGAMSTQVAFLERFSREGYKPVRDFYDMVRPNLDNILDIPLPEGIEVRPVTPDQYRTIWEAEVEAFKDHWGEPTVDEQDYLRWLNHRLFQPKLWQVAWDGDQVAGMIRNFVNGAENEKYGRKRGYVENISVRRPWRKRGLAHALIARSFKMHKDLGMTEAALGVDSENPTGALKVYKDMGFQVSKTFTAYRKPLN